MRHNNACPVFFETQCIVMNQSESPPSAVDRTHCVSVQGLLYANYLFIISQIPHNTIKGLFKVPVTNIQMLPKLILTYVIV